MHHFFGLQVCEHLHDLSSVNPADVDCQLLAGSYQVREIAVLAVLEHEIDELLVHAHPLELDDVRVV